MAFGRSGRFRDVAYDVADVAVEGAAYLFENWRSHGLALRHLRKGRGRQADSFTQIGACHVMVNQLMPEFFIAESHCRSPDSTFVFAEYKTLYHISGKTQ